MPEKRRTVRYRVGSGSSIAVLQSGESLTFPLLDVSTGGLMVTLEEGQQRLLPVGQQIVFELNRPAGCVEMRGEVVHCSHFRRGYGVGLAFTSPGAGGRIDAALGELVGHSEAGGLRLERGAQGIVLRVVGKLSFFTSRDCLSLIRRHAICRIDLTECRGIDSSGLGTLCLARDQRIAIVGARGIVKQMLEMARIPEAAP